MEKKSLKIEDSVTVVVGAAVADVIVVKTVSSDGVGVGSKLGEDVALFSPPKSIPPSLLRLKLGRRVPTFVLWRKFLGAAGSLPPWLLF